VIGEVGVYYQRKAEFWMEIRMKRVACEDDMNANRIFM
jgi:hypothetical protein